MVRRPGQRPATSEQVIRITSHDEADDVGGSSSQDIADRTEEGRGHALDVRVWRGSARSVRSYGGRWQLTCAIMYARTEMLINSTVTPRSSAIEGMTGKKIWASQTVQKVSQVGPARARRDRQRTLAVKGLCKGRWHSRSGPRLSACERGGQTVDPSQPTHDIKPANDTSATMNQRMR